MATSREARPGSPPEAGLPTARAPPPEARAVTYVHLFFSLVLVMCASTFDASPCDRWG